MEIKRIGVVGAGQMGSGIAEVALGAGFEVLMRDIRPDLTTSSAVCRRGR
jgi:3-hydroxybutyryl-CoA dehydrogenase